MLFIVFSVTGLMKVTMPIARLAPIMAWVTDVPPALVRFIGAAELAGALGVLVPALTRVRPALTSLAALGLTVVMALATLVNLARGEAAHAAVSFVLGALAAFVAWERYARAPVTPRGTPHRPSEAVLVRRADRDPMRRGDGAVPTFQESSYQDRERSGSRADSRRSRSSPP